MIWLPFKAKPHEKNKRTQALQKQRYCRLCGKPVNNGGTICHSCSEMMKQKKKEGRTGHNEP